MNKRISCLIVEDEPPAMQLLEDHILKLPMLELKGKAYDALEALELLKHQDVDVIFMDINLPSLTGLEMASLLKPEQRIIFTTAYAEHALESFSFHVVDYLLKPISFKRFLQAVQKLQQYEASPTSVVQGSSQQDMLFLKTGRVVIQVRYDDILFIEGQKEYLCVQTTTKKHLVYKRMKEMAAGLPPSFVRIHHSYIVNLQHVTETRTGSVLLAGNEFPVSQSYREQYRQKLNSLLL